MSKKFILRIAAAAACAAIVIGAGAAALWPRNGENSVPVLPDAPDAADQPVVSGQAEVTDAARQPEVTKQTEVADVVEVEPSYNDRIANGETVTVETYIGKRIEHQDMAFTLKDITVSPTFPEGITKDDIYFFTGPVTAYTDDGTDGLSYSERFYDYSEYAAEHGLPPIETEEAYISGAWTRRELMVRDVIDDNGLYQGPMDVPDEAYKWVFLEIEIENLTEAEKLEYFGDMELCYGDCITVPTYNQYDTEGNVIHTEPEYSEYTVRSSVSYMSEHIDEDNYADLHDPFHNISFAPGEKKSLILGYCVSDHFIYGDLVLQLHNSQPIFYQSEYVYLPLK